MSRLWYMYKKQGNRETSIDFWRDSTPETKQKILIQQKHVYRYVVTQYDLQYYDKAKQAKNSLLYLLKEN